MIHFHSIIVPLVVSAIKLFVIIIILWDESNFCISIHPRELYCFAIRPPVHSRQEDFGLHVECRLGYSCYIGDDGIYWAKAVICRSPALDGLLNGNLFCRVFSSLSHIFLLRLLAVVVEAISTVPGKVVDCVWKSNAICC